MTLRRQDVVFVPYSLNVRWARPFNALLSSIFTPASLPTNSRRADRVSALHMLRRGKWRGVLYADMREDFSASLHEGGPSWFGGFCHRSPTLTYDSWTRLLEYELGIYRAADRVYVGSEAMRRTLDMPTEAIGLPLFGAPAKHPDNDRILFNHRLSKEKGWKNLADLPPDIRDRVTVSTTSHVTRDVGVREVVRNPDTETYHEFLKSRYVLSYDTEESFGYSVIEAVMSGCFGLVPDADTASFRTILPDDMRYLDPGDVPALIRFWDSRPDRRAAAVSEAQEMLWSRYNKNTWARTLLGSMGIEGYGKDG